MTFVDKQPELKLDSSPETMLAYFYFKSELKIGRILEFKSYASIQINSSNKLRISDNVTPLNADDS